MTDETTAATAAATTPEGEGKTFTQEDVNRIVCERLAKDRQKSEAGLAQKERELDKREFALTAQQMLQEKGLPAELLPALDTTSREAFEAAVALVCRHWNTQTETHPPRITVPPDGTAETADPIRGAMGLAR